MERRGRLGIGYKLKFSKQALKDAKNLEECGFDKKAKEILKILKENPYQNPLPHKKLKDDLEGKLSRRINIQHRIICRILEKEKLSRFIKCERIMSEVGIVKCPHL